MIQTLSFTPQFTILVIVAIALGGVDAKPPSRVVGGEDGEIGEFPYQASVKKNGRHICGGTIISKRHILTASHCIDGVSTNPSKEMTVTTGTNALVPGAGVTSTIKSVTLHPDFSNKYEDSWRNDIAIIALTQDIEFNIFTKSARLPKNNTVVNLECIASGWGDMSYPRGMQPNNIRKAAMTTVGNEECNQQHKEMQILDSHLCALATVGVGLCSGDSGGPLAHDGEVVGIASFVLPCARGVPDVFTRVYSYIDFIKKTIAST